MNKIIQLSIAFSLSFILFGCSPKLTSNNKENSTKALNAKEVLLIGTFHFNNPGADVAQTKTFDILKNESQLELEEIASSIKNYNPTKVFVEWPYDEQMELDSLYELYKSGVYFNNKELSDFYKKNEIFQLAFKTAKLNKLDRVHAIDYNETEFPFDSLMQVIEMANQESIQKNIYQAIEKFTADFDSKIFEGTSLKELIYYLNTPELRQFSNKFHNETPLLVGDDTNFIGPFLTSEWYKRNLYMWSLIQKKTEESDQRVMVLVGSSHAAIIENFIINNSDWTVTELINIMKK